MNPEILTIYTDGGSRGNPGPSACGVYLPDLDVRIGKYIGDSETNNTAEYMGLITGLEYALEHKYKRVSIHSDSKLMVNQILGRYRVNAPTIVPLYEQALVLLFKFDEYQIVHVSRELNKEADAEELASEKARSIVALERLREIEKYCESISRSQEAAQYRYAYIGIDLAPRHGEILMMARELSAIREKQDASVQR